MRLLLGLCSKIAHATGADQVPAVRETLGKIAAIESVIAGLVNGQIHAFETWPEGYVCFNRRIMYAGLDWCTQNYTKFVDELREFCVAAHENFLVRDDLWDLRTEYKAFGRPL